MSRNLEFHSVLYGRIPILITEKKGKKEKCKKEGKKQRHKEAEK